MVNKAQSGDGYKCSCGYICDTKGKFITHLGQGSKRDGKGVHKSLGRCNLVTGEITMPPWNERTSQQKDESTFGKRVQKVTPDGKTVNIRTTDVLAQASEIKFIPRIFTTTYTPIMHQAQDAAVRWWGWPANASFEDFLDTVLFKYFKEHGITLGQYGVDESLIAAAVEREKETPVAADVPAEEEE